MNILKNKMMMKLKKIIENNDTLPGRIFDLFIQSLIIISIVCFSIETLPDLDPKYVKILNNIELISVIIFTIEYLLRILVADKKFKFIFSFYGLIDLFAILPFYIMSGIDLRSIRVFRIFRLFRTFKIIRYNNAIKRFYKAFKLIKAELTLFFSTTCLLLYFSSVGIYYFENAAQPEQFKSVFHSLWWAVASLTTVGYGDIYPITAGGKIFTFFILMIGLGIVAIPSGLIASSLTKVMDEEKG